MREVGAYEAKTHIPKLLARVRRGERITITRHGVPIAILIPASPPGDLKAQDAIDDLRNLRKGKALGRLSLRRLIVEGRR